MTAPACELRQSLDILKQGLVDLAHVRKKRRANRLCLVEAHAKMGGDPAVWLPRTHIALREPNWRSASEPACRVKAERSAHPVASTSPNVPLSASERRALATIVRDALARSQLSPDHIYKAALETDINDVELSKASLTFAGFERLCKELSTTSGSRALRSYEVQALFDDLSVSGPAHGEGVPFDLFAVLFCSGRVPAASSRVAERRQGLLREIRSAIRGDPEGNASRLKELSSLGALDGDRFCQAVAALLDLTPGQKPRTLPFKALWLHVAYEQGAEASSITGADVAKFFGDEPADDVVSTPNVDELELSEDKLKSVLAANPNDPVALMRLAEELMKKESIFTMMHNKRVSPKDLLIRSVELRPEVGQAYASLGCALSAEAAVSDASPTALIAGEHLTEKDLYIRAVELDPELYIAYENLADVLSDGEQVKLGRGPTGLPASMVDKDGVLALAARAKALAKGQAVSSERKDPATPSGGPAQKLAAAGATVAKEVVAAPKGTAVTPPSAPTGPHVSDEVRAALGSGVKRRLQGKSPIFRPPKAQLPKIFQDADADGDGMLNFSDLRSYLGDYLGYGHGEIRRFIKKHGDEEGCVKLDAFAMGVKDLNPYIIDKMEDCFIVRKPGAFGGEKGTGVSIADLKRCTVFICDVTAQAQVDALEDCLVLIGPSSSSIFTRECKNCTFWIAAQQLRTRDCHNCTYYLYSKTEPVIESSTGLSFAPFCAFYPGQTEHFTRVGFDPDRNFWSAIFDFTTDKGGGYNWVIRSIDKCEALTATWDHGGDGDPENAAPILTQALLTADPPQPSQSAGQSIANIEQRRPPKPEEVRHPTTGALVDAPKNRRIDFDWDDSQRLGKVEEGANSCGVKPVPAPAADPATALVNESASTLASKCDSAVTFFDLVSEVVSTGHAKAPTPAAQAPVQLTRSLMPASRPGLSSDDEEPPEHIAIAPGARSHPPSAGVVRGRSLRRDDADAEPTAAPTVGVSGAPVAQPKAFSAMARLAGSTLAGNTLHSSVSRKGTVDQASSSEEEV